MISLAPVLRTFTFFQNTRGYGVPQTRAIPELERGEEPVGEMHRNRRGHGLESGFNL